MRTTTHALALAAALVMAATPLTTTTLAQPQSGTKQQQEDRAMWSGPGVLKVDRGEPYFNLDFKGGTLQDYVDYISKQLGYPNFFVQLEARSMELIPVKLNSVGMSYALELVNDLAPSISGNLIQWTEHDGVYKVEFILEQRDVRVPTNEPISVDFPGGTALDFIDAVQAAAGENRVFKQGELSAFKFPAMKLTNTPLRDLVLSMDDTAALDSNGNQIMLRVEDMGGVYKVSTISRGPQAQPRQVAVFPLAQIIAAGFTSAEDTLSAIEAAIESDPAAAKTTSLRYHQPTNVLIVNATPDAIATVDNVLTTLNGIAIEATRLYERQRSWKIQLVQSESQVTKASIELDTLNRRLIRNQERVEEGMQSTSTTDDLRDQIRLAEVNLSAAHAEYAINLEGAEAIQRQIDAYRGNSTN